MLQTGPNTVSLALIDLKSVQLLSFHLLASDYGVGYLLSLLGRLIWLWNIFLKRIQMVLMSTKRSGTCMYGAPK